MSILLRRGVINSVSSGVQLISGSSLSFTPTERLTLSDSLIRLAGSTTMTVTLQFEVESISGTDGAYIGSWSGAKGWMAYMGTDSILFWSDGDSLSYDFSAKSGFINIALIMNGSAKQIWCDGVMVESDSDGSALTDSTIGGQFNSYDGVTSFSKTFDICGYQVFDTVKSSADIFHTDGKLIMRPDDTDLVFGITGLSGHSPFTDQSANSMTVTNDGGVAADGASSSLYSLGDIV